MASDIHDHVDDFEPQVAGIASDLDAVNGTLSSVNEALAGVGDDLALISDDIEQMRQDVEVQWATLLNDQTITLSGEHGLILAQLSTLMAENQALKNEILTAISSQGGSSGSEITETTTVEWFGPETTTWNPTDGWGYNTNTLNIGPTPKRVSLWIYGKTGSGIGAEYWEQHDPSTGSPKDNFEVWIYVNGVSWQHIYLNSETREGYLSMAFNLLEDVPMSGEITLSYRRTLSDSSMDTDPFVITWYVQ